MMQGVPVTAPGVAPATTTSPVNRDIKPFFGTVPAFKTRESASFPWIEFRVRIQAFKLGHNGARGCNATSIRFCLNDTVKTPEQEAALRSIRKLIEFWRISPDELAFDLPETADAPAVPETLPPKYRHPVTGDTWDGQGSQPQWLREALTRQGYTVEEVRCASPDGMDIPH